MTVDMARHRLGFFATAVLLGVLMASLALPIDSTLPSMPLAAADFGVSDGAIQFSLSVFLAGIAAGQLFYGPISDRFGRRPVLLVAFVVFVASAAGCALSALERTRTPPNRCEGEPAPFLDGVEQRLAGGDGGED